MPAHGPFPPVFADSLQTAVAAFSDFQRYSVEPTTASRVLAPQRVQL
nr:MAG TPA: hypothetical protein [Caudoviricetes sp.]